MSVSTTAFAASILAISTVSTCNIGTGAGNSGNGTVTIDDFDIEYDVDMDCGLTATDAVVVEKAAPTSPLNVHEMSLILEYDGGCAIHEFELCVRRSYDVDGYPYLMVDVMHDANGDTCTQPMTLDVVVDPSLLIRAAEQEWSTEDYHSLELSVGPHGEDDYHSRWSAFYPF